MSVESRNKMVNEGVPYHWTLWNHLKRLNVIDISEKLEETFTFIQTVASERGSIIVDMALEFEFKADAFFTFIEPRRTILFQKESRPFTKKNLELRKTIFTVYSHRDLLIFQKESKFETID